MKLPSKAASASASARDDIPILDDPQRLADLQGWSEEVYADFLALQDGRLSKQDFRDKYLHTRAILDLDITGFTKSSIQHGQIDSLLRIFDTQKIAIPVLHGYEACFVRAFADDLVALFEDVHRALDAAIEINKRTARFNKSSGDSAAQCCIGIGFGQVYAIGPNLAQGTEMNLASKLGEDIACGGEILVTEQAFAILGERTDVEFERQTHDELEVDYFKASLSSGWLG